MSILLCTFAIKKVTLVLTIKIARVMMYRVFFKKEEQLHNAVIYLKRTYGGNYAIIRKGLRKGTVGMLEVSEYQAEILKSSYETI